MAYRFSGLAGSQALQTDVGIVWPSAFPYSIAGWSRSDNLAVDGTVLCPAIDGDVESRRIQFGWEAAGRWQGYHKTSTVGQQSLTIAFPTWLTTRDWVFLAYVLRSDTDKQLYAVVRGRLFSSAIGTTSLAHVAFDRLTAGYLPFFGNLNDFQGSAGPHGVWSRQLTEPEIGRMGRGEPLTAFNNGLYAYWDMDGRVVNVPVRDLRYRLPFTTITGPPAWDPDGPRVRRDLRVIVRVAATTILPQMMENH